MRSPIDGSGSTSGAEDGIAYPNSTLQDSSRPGMGSGGMPLGMAGSMNILGKPMATNNFVTKLYQSVVPCRVFFYVNLTLHILHSE
jgi:hypothetical protein